MCARAPIQCYYTTAAYNVWNEHSHSKHTQTHTYTAELNESIGASVHEKSNQTAVIYIEIFERTSTTNMHSTQIFILKRRTNKQQKVIEKWSRSGMALLNERNELLIDSSDIIQRIKLNENSKEKKKKKSGMDKSNTFIEIRYYSNIH